MVVTRLQLVIVGSLGVGEQKAAMKDYMAGLDVYHLSDGRAVLGAPLFPIWEVTNPDAPKPELINQETGARARFAYPHNDCAFMMFACRKKDCCFADFIRCNVYKHEKTLGHFLATEVREKRKRSVVPNIEDNVLVKQFEENQKKFVEQPESPSKVLNKTITIDEDSEDSAKGLEFTKASTNALKRKPRLRSRSEPPPARRVLEMDSPKMQFEVFVDESLPDRMVRSQHKN